MIDFEGPAEGSSDAPDAPMGACSFCLSMKLAMFVHGVVVRSPNAGLESVAVYAKDFVLSNRPTALFRPPIAPFAV